MKPVKVWICLTCFAVSVLQTLSHSHEEPSAKETDSSVTKRFASAASCAYRSPRRRFRYTGGPTPGSWYYIMGHGGMSKRQLVLPPTNDRVDNSLPQFPRPPSDRPSLPAVAQFGDHDRRRHPLFPAPHRGHLRPGHRPPASSAVDNPLFPLMSAGEDGSVGGRTLLRDFITFLDLKGRKQLDRCLSSSER